jgi:hypothetical protein
MVKVYIEGGGDSSALKRDCRRAFAEFFKKAGITGKKLDLVACGSRQNAYKMFCIAIRSGEDALLLVDSEEPVAAKCQQGEMNTWLPWSHLAQREGDKWQKPTNAAENQCHLMVQCMENWFQMGCKVNHGAEG